MTDDTLLFQKVMGLLIGGAIGDAFGIRVEMMHYLDIEEQYGRIEHFDPIPWRTPSKQPPGEQWNPFGVQPQNEQGCVERLVRVRQRAGGPMFNDGAGAKILEEISAPGCLRGCQIVASYFDRLARPSFASV